MSVCELPSDDDLMKDLDRIWDNRLTTWEINFVDSLRRRMGPWTNRQIEIAEKIIAEKS